MLNPTPPELLMDAQRRPYFLWDTILTVDELRQRLEAPDIQSRAYWIAKVMRQAKPDDVFTFVTLEQIARDWPQLHRYLGDKASFWSWWMDMWESQGRVKR